MKPLNEYYEALEVPFGAWPEKVRQAYRDLVKIWHPDRFAHDPRLQAKAEERLKEINEAFEHLKDVTPDSQRTGVSARDPGSPSHDQSTYQPHAERSAVGFTRIRTSFFDYPLGGQMWLEIYWPLLPLLLAGLVFR